jgi:hypothetical protein
MKMTEAMQLEVDRQVKEALDTLAAASEKKEFDNEVARQVKAALAKLTLPEARPMVWEASKTITQSEGEFENVFTSHDLREVVQVMKDYRLEANTSLVRKRGEGSSKTSLYKNSSTGTLTFMQYSKLGSRVALHLYELGE